MKCESLGFATNKYDELFAIDLAMNIIEECENTEYLFGKINYDVVIFVDIRYALSCIFDDWIPRLDTHIIEKVKHKVDIRIFSDTTINVHWLTITLLSTGTSAHTNSSIILHYNANMFCGITVHHVYPYSFSSNIHVYASPLTYSFNYSCNDDYNWPRTTCTTNTN